MPELFGVGGAICVKPESCSRCLVGVPVTFRGVRAVDPQNNRIEALCASCADREERLAEWHRNHPEESAKIEDLADQGAVNAGWIGRGFDDRENQQIQRCQDRLDEKLAAYKRAVGYPS
jgi:hypothetical protein